METFAISIVFSRSFLSSDFPSLDLSNAKAFREIGLCQRKESSLIAQILWFCLRNIKPSVLIKRSILSPIKSATVIAL